MKLSRQYAIKEIISTLPIANQDDLRLELKKRGINVTQATLSRDLMDLGVGRISAGKHNQYVLQSDAEVKLLRPVIGTQVISIKNNEYLVVVRTLPGCANVAGEFIDAQNNKDIIGTLAGDNTLLVIPASTKKLNKVVEFLKTILFESEK
jgi:transcriptional regulator of arginine metabolism